MKHPGQLDMLAALRRVEENATPDFLTQARQAVICLARSGEPFTTEDAKRLVNASTHEPRAWGSVMATLSREGVIRQTGELRKARNRVAHVRPMTVWIGTAKVAA